MRVIGLTGSLGMGKSTTAGFFADAGVPVHDADAAVHRLYRGAAVALVEAAFPGIVSEGAIDREKLARYVVGHPDAMKKLEAIVHPLVREEEIRFLEAARGAHAPIVVLDIPLLFEVGADRRVHTIVVVTAPAEIQRARALARPGMTEDKLQGLLAKQMPDAEKRARADFVVDTSLGFDSARAQVRAILDALANRPPTD